MLLYLPSAYSVFVFVLAAIFVLSIAFGGGRVARRTIATVTLHCYIAKRLYDTTILHTTGQDDSRVRGSLELVELGNARLDCSLLILA